MRLVIGNKTYSSWSLRAWAAARLSGLPFEEVLVPLDTPEFASQVRKVSPAARVPVLVDGDLAVWDSLAIIEYLAELAPAGRLWPQDRAARARARSICAEFHSGFPDLRGHYPMNLRRTPSPHPRLPDAAKDIVRVCEIWRECRSAHAGQGDFLFGAFSAADCFFAPVVSRFLTYLLPMGEVERAYAEAVMAHPILVEWREGAATETWVVDADEVD